MLRADGIQIPLEEDQFGLDRVWMNVSESGAVIYYFGWRSSIRQALRLLDPGTRFELRDLFMWGGPSGSIGLKDAPPLGTVGEAMDWLSREMAEGGDLTDLTCVVADFIEVDTHDDTEVSMEGPVSSSLRNWAARFLESRGFDAAAILGAMETNRGKLLAIGAPAAVLGIYDSLKELKKAHPER